MAKQRRSHSGLLIFLVLVMGLAAAFLFHRKTEAPAVQSTNTVTTQNTGANSNSTTPTGTSDQLAAFKTLHSIDDPTSIWLVVNKTRPFNPIDYAPSDLVSVGGGQQMRADAASALKNLQDAAKTQGLTISALSGYRSYAIQVSVYNGEVKSFGQAKADTESARPGTSEHQSGWAVDVGGGGCGIEDCFGNTAEGKWLAANAYKYGFIIRYTTDKQAITGYRAEPWHIRYIGSDLSNRMHQLGITTLEEFFGLPAAPDYPKN